MIEAICEVLDQISIGAEVTGFTHGLRVAATR